jgi:hypothetical protein
MSDKPGLLDEIKRWLEVEEETPAAPSPADDQLKKLREQLAMEQDPEKRKALKDQIERLEISEDEPATIPVNVIGPY